MNNYRSISICSSLYQIFEIKYTGCFKKNKPTLNCCPSHITCKFLLKQVILWPTSTNPWASPPLSKKKNFKHIAWNLHFLCVCSSLIQTHFFPNSKVLFNFSHNLRRYMLNKWIYWSTFCLITSRVIGLSANTVCFTAPHSQKSNGLRSGLYGTHSWSMGKEARIKKKKGYNHVDVKNKTLIIKYIKCGMAQGG